MRSYAISIAENFDTGKPYYWHNLVNTNTNGPYGVRIYQAISIQTHCRDHILYIYLFVLTMFYRFYVWKFNDYYVMISFVL